MEYQVWCDKCDQVLATFGGKDADYKANQFAREHNKLLDHSAGFGEHTPRIEQEGVENREARL